MKLLRKKSHERKSSSSSLARLPATQWLTIILLDALDKIKIKACTRWSELRMKSNAVSLWSQTKSVVLRRNSLWTTADTTLAWIIKLTMISPQIKIDLDRLKSKLWMKLWENNLSPIHTDICCNKDLAVPMTISLTAKNSKDPRPEVSSREVEVETRTKTLRSLHSLTTSSVCRRFTKTLTN